ncbi:MAG: CotH kinase family protein [Candidatus Solibacter sp.]
MSVSPNWTVKLAICAAALALAQAQDFGGRGFGAAGQRVKLLPQFDAAGKGYLDAAERKAAREYMATQPRRGGGRFRNSQQGPPAPGPRVTPAQVKNFGSESLYDETVLRTLFLEFEAADWEKEMADFYHTDVDVPAKLTVDGKVYPDVGVHFRGQSSYSTVPEGRKRSLDVSLNYLHGEQRLNGYRSLNLLNANADPTFMRTALFQHVARQYIAAPKANWVRVVINGESWGIYVNTQQINADFTQEWFQSAKGARWKVPGSPAARGGLAYLGEDAATYKGSYELKTKDDPKAWEALIHLCKVLNQTPPAQLEKELEPLLDIEGTLRFLALDKAAINNDGYWVRTSDYGIYLDPKGRFHLIPWDANETFRETEAMARRGGVEIAGGARLDPFTGAEDPQKALLYRLLKAPTLRARYLADLRDIATNWLDWGKVGPLVNQWQSLILADVKSDTRKIFSTESFTKSVTQDDFEPGSGPTAPSSLSLKSFIEQRGSFLLSYPGIRLLEK